MEGDFLMGSQNHSNGKELQEFFLGILLLGVGLFLFTQNVTVTGGYGSFRLGFMNIPSGVTTIPFIVGVVWYFIDKSFFSKVLIWLGAIFIILGVVMSVRIYFERASLFFYIITVMFLASGFGLLVKVLFKKR